MMARTSTVQPWSVRIAVAETLASLPRTRAKVRPLIFSLGLPDTVSRSDM